VRARIVAGNADAFLNALTLPLSAGLEALAATVRARDFTIDNSRLIIPRLSADILPEGADQLVRFLRCKFQTRRPAVGQSSPLSRHSGLRQG
jgi:hypothetical protein